MAIRQVLTRHTSWMCRNCEENSGQKNNQTTQSAEQHADEKGHSVVLSGMITYVIAPGKIENDDPFSSRT
jgi:hypothetical protein